MWHEVMNGAAMRNVAQGTVCYSPREARGGMWSLPLLVALASVGPLFEIRAADGPSPHFHADEIPAVPQTAAGRSSKTRRIGEDWSEFLGPRGTGISGETGLLEAWPKSGPPIVFKKRVGTGYSAPSVKGNRLVLFHRVGEEEVVECFDADTGAFDWRYAYFTAYQDPYGYNNGPRCTPLLTETRCYTFGAEGVLACLDLETGRKIWRRNVGKEFKIPESFFGIGASPILEGNRLIVMVGGAPQSGMVAFDAETGATLWESVGLDTFPEPKTRVQRDNKLSSYSTPFAVTIHGERHVLSYMRPGLVSLNPADGKVRFSLFFRPVVKESVNAARPVVVGNQVFLSSAYDLGAMLLAVKPGNTEYDVVWQDELAMQNHWSTSIYHHGYLYGFSGRHEPGSTFRCIDWKSGQLKWETKDINALDEPDPRAGLGATAPKYYGRGSAILAEGKFIVLAERGTLALVDVNPEKFREISRVKYPEMEYPSWTAPVLSRRRLYLRDEDHLLCLDLAKKP